MLLTSPGRQEAEAATLRPFHLPYPPTGGGGCRAKGDTGGAGKTKHEGGAGRWDR